MKASDCPARTDDRENLLGTGNMTYDCFGVGLQKHIK